MSTGPVTADEMVVWEALQQFIDNSEWCEEDPVVMEKVARAERMVDDLTVRFVAQYQEAS